MVSQSTLAWSDVALSRGLDSGDWIEMDTPQASGTPAESRV